MAKKEEEKKVMKKQKKKTESKKGKKKQKKPHRITRVGKDLQDCSVQLFTYHHYFTLNYIPQYI